MFNCYGNVDELVGPHVGCLRHINDLCTFFLQGNYPPTSKGDVEDGSIYMCQHEEGTRS